MKKISQYKNDKIPGDIGKLSDNNHLVEMLKFHYNRDKSVTYEDGGISGFTNPFFNMAFNLDYLSHNSKVKPFYEYTARRCVLELSGYVCSYKISSGALSEER